LAVPIYNTSSAPRKPSAEIISFPSSRCRAVRVEREVGDLGWLTLLDACGELHGDFDAALAEARKIAREFNLTIWSSAGRIAL
jgi:hypothetical protein